MDHEWRCISYGNILILVIQSDPFGMVKWPFTGLSDLQLGNNMVTLNPLDFFHCHLTSPAVLPLERTFPVATGDFYLPDGAGSQSVSFWWRKEISKFQKDLFFCWQFR